MPSRQTLDLLQSQTSQQLPCADSRYRTTSVAVVLAQTKLTAAEVGPAVAAYLRLIARDAYLVGLRARGNAAGGAGARTLAVLSSAGQKHSDDVCRTDGPYFSEAAAVVAARAEVERVSGGRVLEACTVYLYGKDCCDEAERQRILGAFQLLARCAFALLNRLERQLQERLSREDVERLLAILRREIRDSRRDVMPKVFLKGGPAKTLLVVCMPTAVTEGEVTRPLLLAWIARVTQEEICRGDVRRFLDSQFHQPLLACLACHFAFALPMEKDALDIKRAQYGVSKVRAADGKYWGFEDDDECFDVLYGMPMALIADVPEPTAGLLLSDAHTKGPHHLLDLDSFATVKLIGDAYNQGSPCGAVEVAHFLKKRDSYQTPNVKV